MGYVLSLPDDAMFYLSKKEIKEGQHDRSYEFGVGDDYYYPVYELVITVKDFFEIGEIACFVRERIFRVGRIELPDKTGMERVPRAFFLPPENMPGLRLCGDFILLYTQEIMKFEFCEGKAERYYEDNRLEAYYDENDTLLFFVVKLFDQHEFSHIMAKREEMIAKYDISY